MFRNDLRLHYTTENAVTWPFMQVQPLVYKWILYYLNCGCVCMLGAVEWGIYLYISMGTTMSMMLLFTWSSRILRVNVGSHTIIFKSLCFGPFTLKRNPRVLNLKRGLQRFQKSPFWSVYTTPGHCKAPGATSGPLAILDRPAWGNLWINSQSQIGVIRCTQYNRAAFIFL